MPESRPNFQRIVSSTQHVDEKTELVNWSTVPLTAHRVYTSMRRLNSLTGVQFHWPLTELSVGTPSGLSMQTDTGHLDWPNIVPLVICWAVSTSVHWTHLVPLVICWAVSTSVHWTHLYVEWMVSTSVPYWSTLNSVSRGTWMTRTEETLEMQKGRYRNRLKERANSNSNRIQKLYFPKTRFI